MRQPADPVLRSTSTSRARPRSSGSSCGSPATSCGFWASRSRCCTNDQNGRRGLERWIADLIDLLTRHQATFLLWAQVQFTEPGLVEIGRWNLSGYQRVIAERLAAAGAHPPTPNVVPVGILSVVQWSYFYFLVSDAEGVPAAARARAGRTPCSLSLRTTGSAEPAAGGRCTMSTSCPNIPLGDAMGLRRPVTARGVGTVQRILLAAAERFRSSGFYGTSLSDVAAAAGVSHGSVYTYWADRDSLFATLAQDAVAAVESGSSALAGRPADARTDWPAGWTAGCPCSAPTARCSTSGPTRWTCRQSPS